MGVFTWYVHQLNLQSTQASINFKILSNPPLTMIYSVGLNMILRDLSAFNMGRGAYDTTGVKKPGAPQPPPK